MHYVTTVQQPAYSSCTSLPVVRNAHFTRSYLIASVKMLLHATEDNIHTSCTSIPLQLEKEANMATSFEYHPIPDIGNIGGRGGIDAEVVTDQKRTEKIEELKRKQQETESRQRQNVPPSK